MGTDNLIDLVAHYLHPHISLMKCLQSENIEQNRDLHVPQDTQAVVLTCLRLILNSASYIRSLNQKLFVTK